MNHLPALICFGTAAGIALYVLGWYWLPWFFSKPHDDAGWVARIATAAMLTGLIIQIISFIK